MQRTGESLIVGNEFAEVRVTLVTSRNGTRLLIESTRSDHAVSLCPLELEALTWQDTCTFTAMIAKPMIPMLDEDD
jgi:hypothetical protein